LLQTINIDFKTIPIANRILLLFFLTHYFNRTFIYSYKIVGGTPTTFFAFIAACMYTACNGYLQSLCLLKFDEYNIDNIFELHYIIGVTLWLIGFCITCQSDSILRNLRKPNETGYKIPKQGLFQYVSSAHYFGEIIEWLGFAIAGNNGGGYSFLFFLLLLIYIHEQYLLIIGIFKNLKIIQKIEKY